MRLASNSWRRSMTRSADKSVTVALLDDRSEESIAPLRSFLVDELGYHLIVYEDYKRLRALIQEGKVDRVIVNFTLGGRDLGRVFIRRLHNDGFHRYIPVVLFSSDSCHQAEARRLFEELDFEYGTFVEKIADVHHYENSLKRVLSRSIDNVNIDNLSNIFVVHGRHVNAVEEGRETVLHRVTRLLEHNLGLRTQVIKDDHIGASCLFDVIEKAMDQCAMAIVLLTGDDLGCLRTHASGPEVRARQNVLFEAGLALGKLGQNRTLFLKECNVILPSDLNGVHYLQIEDFGDSDLVLKFIQMLQKLGIPFFPRGS
jgi:predicted nucleotide-binding protein